MVNSRTRPSGPFGPILPDTRKLPRQCRDREHFDQTMETVPVTNIVWSFTRSGGLVLSASCGGPPCFHGSPQKCDGCTDRYGPSFGGTSPVFFACRSAAF